MRRLQKASSRPTKRYSIPVPRGQSNFTPENTWNYQIGSSRQLDDLVVSADAYYIDFSNFYQIKTFGGVSGPISLGGARYMGLEGELTYVIGGGFSAYANGSLNSAKQTNRSLYTTAQRLDQRYAGRHLGRRRIFNRYGFYASLLGKYTGARPGDDGLGSGSPFFTLDASLDYDLTRLTDVVKNAFIKLDVQNLTNVTKIIYNPGTTLGNPYNGMGGDNLYWTEPGRSVFVTLSTTF